MPSTYTHYRFGNLVIPLLPNELQEIVYKYRPLFDIGTHGPDIFFYHQPYHSDNINKVGHNMHKETAAKFFLSVKDAYTNAGEYKDAVLAYLLGFCSHYCLDFSDHSYIESKIHKSNVSHTLIEVEYDRYLLVKDGIDPFKKDMASHIIANNYNASVIQKCFTNFNVKVVRSCLKQMAFYVRLTNLPSGAKRNSLMRLMKTIGAYDALHEQFISIKPSQKCMDSNLRLDKLEVKARSLFKELAVNLTEFLNSQAKLDERFEYTFSYQDGWEDIPVYNFEQEKEYEI